jgi:hypothetical protein
VSSYLFVATNFTKFYFLMLKKKIWSNLKKIIELFTQKIVNKLSKIWVWYPGSGKTYSGSWIPDPGLKKAPDPGSGSATLIYYIYIDSICRFLFFFFTRKFRCHWVSTNLTSLELLCRLLPDSRIFFSLHQPRE